MNKILIAPITFSNEDLAQTFRDLEYYVLDKGVEDWIYDVVIRKENDEWIGTLYEIQGMKEIKEYIDDKNSR